jgi:uncharacterized protein YndB with AHSA1/START domain
VLRSPEGQQMTVIGCYLEVVQDERLVWTTALQPGYRPSRELPFTAVITLEPHGSGTKYTALAIHSSEEESQRHNEMGFREGWGKALDQFVALMAECNLDTAVAR